MAMIDYGAIAFKNGKLISTAMFSPMKDMVGWEDTETDVYYNYNTNEDRPLNLAHNYFAYIGDPECTLAFYKDRLVTVERLEEGRFIYNYEFFNCTPFTWSKWEKGIGVSGESLSRVKVTKRNGYLVCRWNYKGDKYKVYFGYGVDFDYYKKYGIVNYYRSSEYRVRKIKRWFTDVVEDLRRLKERFLKP